MQGVLSDAEMKDLLTAEVFGHLGCFDGGKPYVVPLAYVYHNNTIYGQTTEGRKVEILRKNPLVCFQVEKLHDRKWSSVMCWGAFEELAFEDLRDPQAIFIVKLLTERIGKIQENVGVEIPFSFSDGAIALRVNDKQSTLFRIRISEKSGRWYAAEK